MVFVHISCVAIYYSRAEWAIKNCFNISQWSTSDASFYVTESLWLAQFSFFSNWNFRKKKKTRLFNRVKEENGFDTLSFRWGEEWLYRYYTHSTFPLRTIPSFMARLKILSTVIGIHTKDWCIYSIDGNNGNARCHVWHILLCDFFVPMNFGSVLFTNWYSVQPLKRGWETEREKKTNRWNENWL